MEPGQKFHLIWYNDGPQKQMNSSVYTTLQDHVMMDVHWYNSLGLAPVYYSWFLLKKLAWQNLSSICRKWTLFWSWGAAFGRLRIIACAGELKLAAKVWLRSSRLWWERSQVESKWDAGSLCFFFGYKSPADLVRSWTMHCQDQKWGLWNKSKFDPGCENSFSDSVARGQKKKPLDRRWWVEEKSQNFVTQLS